MQLELEVKNSQLFLPNIIEFMEILQMDMQQFTEYIIHIAQENPVLELNNEPEDLKRVEEIIDRLTWIENSDEQSLWYCKQEDENSIFDIKDRSSTSGYDEDLWKHLIFQLDNLALENRERAFLLYLILCLDDMGYMKSPIAELAVLTGASVEEIEVALYRLQKFDPPGIGARDLSECLCIQLEQKGEMGLPYMIAKDYLEQIGKNMYGYISRMTGAAESDIKSACSVIRKLNPKPGANFVHEDNNFYITPDVIIDKKSGCLEIKYNSDYGPSLKINKYYLDLARNTKDAQVTCYLAEKIRQARWVMQCINQRNSTFSSCIDEIVKRQKQYFWGSAPLKPMTLKEVADALEINVSTVSRALKGKYIQTVHGVCRVTELFSKRLKESSGREVSADMAKNEIVRLIESEDKLFPLSDSKICEELLKQNIDISRRTVAKYRDQQNILAAAYRRK
ncbi:MAG: RNA polymerase factor sigma-54 [Anaerolineaceae bacterium]|nr:RNA polymerase factor sigma-54 [Anaerolineaceae bacterium]